jgi:hypothetical protein
MHILFVECFLFLNISSNCNCATNATTTEGDTQKKLNLIGRPNFIIDLKGKCWLEFLIWNNMQTE